jgi:hypothetical protein
MFETKSVWPDTVEERNVFRRYVHLVQNIRVEFKKNKFENCKDIIMYMYEECS